MAAVAGEELIQVNWDSRMIFAEIYLPHFVFHCSCICSPILKCCWNRCDWRFVVCILEDCSLRTFLPVESLVKIFSMDNTEGMLFAQELLILIHWHLAKSNLFACSVCFVTCVIIQVKLKLWSLSLMLPSSLFVVILLYLLGCCKEDKMCASNFLHISNFCINAQYYVGFWWPSMQLYNCWICPPPLPMRFCSPLSNVYIYKNKIKYLIVKY